MTRPALVVLALLLVSPSLLTAEAAEKPPLQFVLLFHYNQNVVPYARAADDIIYRDLTRLLLQHPDLNFTLHVSGVLLESLQWMDPTFVRLLRDGVQSGSFEILGSTYAQNLLHSTRRDANDVGMNHNQNRVHRETLQRLLNVTPTGYWNAERVWSQELLDLIADDGYAYTFVEDHIQARAATQGSEHLVRTSRTDRNQLAIFNDDKAFMHLVDRAIDDGNWEPVFQHLSKLHAEPDAARYVVVYAQDAESSGLWDFEGGSDPADDLRNLDAFFRRVKSTPWLRMITPQQYLDTQAPAHDVTPIPAGAADWMGKDRWFEEQDDPNVVEYRRRFGQAYDGIAALESSLPTSQNPDAARRLIDLARHSLAAHQYEFADAVHQNNSGLTEWELYRSALTFTEAARRAAAYTPGSPRAIASSDVNEDGRDEVLVQDGRFLYVFTLRGARILHWFDLERGLLLTGLNDFTDYGERGNAEDRHVPDLVGGKNTYTWLATRTGKPEIFDHVYRIRRSTLGDHVHIPLGPNVQLNHTGAIQTAAYQEHADGLTFDYEIPLNAPSDRLRVRKTFSFSDQGMNVQYRVADDRLRDAPAPVRANAPPIRYVFSVEACLNPDAVDARHGGIDQILVGAPSAPLATPWVPTLLARGIPGPQGPLAVANAHTREGVVLDAGGTLRLYGGLYCLLANATRNLELRPGQAAEFPVTLHAFHDASTQPLPATVPDAGSLRLPSYVRMAYAQRDGRDVPLRVQTDGTLAGGDAGDLLRYEYTWDPAASVDDAPPPKRPTPTTPLALVVAALAVVAAGWRGGAREN